MSYFATRWLVLGRFISHIKSKLQPRGDVLFQICKKNQWQHLQSRSNKRVWFSATFNIFVLCLFDINDNSMSNTFKEKKDEMDQPTLTIDSLEVPIGSITWLKAKNLNEVLNGFV